MRSKRRSSPEIELTPLVDVVFQLIIFFVLTAAFVQGSITVSLPEGTGQAVSQTPLVINVDQNGEIFVNDKKAEIPEAVDLAREW
ncbi:MAG: biopolymer transporter ExbD [Acetomicrobium sp.]